MKTIGNDGGEPLVMMVKILLLQGDMEPECFDYKQALRWGLLTYLLCNFPVPSHTHLSYTSAVLKMCI